MWVQFFLALPAFIAILYVPGYLFSRLLSDDFMLAIATAPLASTCVYSLLGILFGEMGVYTTWITLVAPSTLIGIGCYVLTWRRRKATMPSRQVIISEMKSYLPYIVFAACVCMFYFIKPLDGPESFTWRTDNTHHLNLVARFIRSGNWSMMHTSLYEDVNYAALNFSSYYPACWHILVCLISSLLGVSAMFAANVANAVLITITIPTSSYILIRTVFPDKSLAVRLGAIFPLAFGVFPWHIIIPEAKVPFFLALAYAPVVLTTLVISCEGLLAHKLNVPNILLFLMGLFACALVHPCGVFSVAVLSIPYLVWVSWRAGTMDKSSNAGWRRGLLYVALFLTLVVAVWAFLLHIPAIESMTYWNHPAYKSLREAVLRVVFMGFKDVPAQPLLAMFVWIGIVYSLYRTRYLWMTCGFGIFSVFYLIAATTERPIKRYLTGFWYTDFNRLAASALIMAVPLAALGLYATVRIAQHLFVAVSDHADDPAAKRFVGIVGPLFLAFASAMTIYYPSFQMPHQANKTTTGFGYVAKRAREYNSYKKNIMSEEELDFLDEVREVVGDDLLINFPYDGSAFAYATSDLNVYTRRYNYLYYCEDARVIDADLVDITTDKEVASLVNNLNAKYVLLLDIDEDAEEATVYEDGFNRKRWRGLVELDDDTPGFEIVLSKGDMRLYRIVDEAA